MALRPDFDYTSPFYYMVTLRVKEGIEPLSILRDQNPYGFKSTRITTKMKGVFYWMNHRAYAHRMKISHYIIMPNHIHFIVKIAEGEKRVSLIEIVKKLMSVLSQAYYDALGLPKGESIFEARWHDWIVRKANALTAFITYVKQNPQRTLFRLRYANSCLPRYYTTPDGEVWTAIGTLSGRQSPVRAPIICSRKIISGTPLWEEWKAFAQRLGPGCVAIGTFMSPCEKMVRDEVLKAGGGIIRLIPEGISPKGHPSLTDEVLCANERLTILTPFPHIGKRLTKKELYDRCHTTLQAYARRWQRNISILPPSAPLA